MVEYQKLEHPSDKSKKYFNAPVTELGFGLKYEVADLLGLMLKSLDGRIARVTETYGERSGVNVTIVPNNGKKAYVMNLCSVSSIALGRYQEIIKDGLKLRYGINVDTIRDRQDIVNFENQIAEKETKSVNDKKDSLEALANGWSRFVDPELKNKDEAIDILTPTIDRLNAETSSNIIVSSTVSKSGKVSSKILSNVAAENVELSRK